MHNCHAHDQPKDTNRGKSHLTATRIAALLIATPAFADGHSAVDDAKIAAQRAALAANTDAAGFGPQSPRDIDAVAGANARTFEAAPAYTQMILCNIHFHENAEHKGGKFTTYAGKGAATGYAYNGTLTEAELAPTGKTIGAGKFGSLERGDTIEIHSVHTTAQITPSPTLGACLTDSISNPQLRVEAQVFVLVNDDSASNFVALNKVEQIDGQYRAVNIPTDTGTPVQYAGSTTGPGYNEAGSPLQVSWSVRPNVMKVSIASVDAWLQGNVFDEDHAHGVRNLVKNPDLLSEIGG